MNTDKPWRPGDVKSGMHNEALFVWHSDGVDKRERPEPSDEVTKCKKK